MKQPRFITSNRLEALCADLAKICGRPLRTALEQEIIIVQSPGMERWISMQLSQRFGVWANCRFPYPHTFVEDLLYSCFPQVERSFVYSPQGMLWSVMDILPSMLDRAEFSPVLAYFKNGETDLKQYQFSRKLAGLYLRYLVHRPEMILDWDKGKTQTWQAMLWQEIAAKGGPDHLPALGGRWVREIDRIDNALLPSRISFLGTPALPKFYLDLLLALGKRIEVNFLLLNPCREFWDDISSTREIDRRAKKQDQQMDLFAQEQHFETGNSLLASLGTSGRVFFCAAHESIEEQGHFIDPAGDTLLHQIQSDILTLTQPTNRSCSPADESIRIHSCHSPMREIEVLNDRLLHLFDTIPGLEPRDVLVMTAKIADYAPLIEAVFGTPENELVRIPYSIADGTVATQSRPADVLMKILSLGESRAAAPEIIDMLEADPVRNKLGLSEPDLDILRNWIFESGIRWGLDENHRAKLIETPTKENTWKLGIDRMLLGYAMGEADSLYDGILPYSGPGISDAQVLGQFLDFFHSLSATISELGKERSLKDWAALLSQILDDFLLVEDTKQNEMLRLRGVVQSLSQATPCFPGIVGLGIVREHLGQILQNDRAGRGFLTGGVTFSSMLPMRSIPFRVIALLGMNEADFPRKERNPSFDVMTAAPRPDDPSKTAEDKYLFLETILSSRDVLHISYVGQDVHTNSPRQPSIVVQELGDYVRSHFDPATDLLVVHPLQAFNTKYFDPDSRHSSFSRENGQAAQCRAGHSQAEPALVFEPLSEPGNEWRNLDLNALTRFLCHPARFFFQQRLGASLRIDSAYQPGLEPFVLDRLETYDLLCSLNDALLRGEKESLVYERIKAAGKIPHGSVGQYVYRSMLSSLQPYIDDLRQFIGKPKTPDLPLDLTFGPFALSGKIGPVLEHGLLRFRPAKIKAKDRIAAWVHHLALNAVAPEPVRRTCLIGLDTTLSFSPVQNPKAILEDLIEIFWRGLRTPLAFFPETSWAYAEALSRGKTEQQATERALQHWNGDPRFTQPESQDPYYAKAAKGPAGNQAFGQMARAILSPLMEHMEKGMAE